MVGRDQDAPGTVLSVMIIVTGESRQKGVVITTEGEAEDRLWCAERD